jgi:hypothetical protein
MNVSTNFLFVMVPKSLIARSQRLLATCRRHYRPIAAEIDGYSTGVVACQSGRSLERRCAVVWLWSGCGPALESGAIGEQSAQGGTLDMASMAQILEMGECLGNGEAPVVQATQPLAK